MKRQWIWMVCGPIAGALAGLGLSHLPTPVSYVGLGAATGYVLYRAVQMVRPSRCAFCGQPTVLPLFTTTAYPRWKMLLLVPPSGRFVCAEHLMLMVRLAEHSR
jgi:hypothetical protein